MSDNLRLIKGKKQDELSFERGGRGSTQQTARAERPFYPTTQQLGSTPAASLPASSTQLASSQYKQPTSAYTPLELLPVGKQQAEAAKRLEQLKAAYEELHHTEQAIKWIGRYLPKLALNQELASNKQRLIAHIKQLATGAPACQPSSSKSPASS